jgi:hydrogenase maturation protein HypF
MSLERRRIRVTGLVQGVGFRPFVYKQAAALGLTGWVHNDAHGVLVEIQGPSSILEQFQATLTSAPPPLANITHMQVERLSPQAETDFIIKTSRHQSQATALISADIAACPQCLQEMRDDQDRRFHYPFSNCTNCGPRFTIVRSIPYDRANTSMSVFPLCPRCAQEYDDPMDRRFHAQPTACPHCGPSLTLCTPNGEKISCQNPIDLVWHKISEGGIVALRGLGGFHLVVDARNPSAIDLLRQRKGRQEKPFAIMARDLNTIERYVVINDQERELLQSHASPIVLLLSRGKPDLPDNIAPGHRYLGFMLPYTPLHHLLLSGPHDLLIMTSGNYSEEPIAISNREALTTLCEIADLFLLHNREILQRCDDSVVMVVDHAPRLIRRSRGYVPAPIILNSLLPHRVLACGGALKNTVAIGRADKVILSQHIGDLDHPAAFDFFQHAIAHLQHIFEFTPDLIACDMHPDYFSSQWAQRQAKLPVVTVQHHHAHMASVMAEHHIEEPCIGIILDGTGYGSDGTIWGGEVLLGDYHSYTRWAWLQPVPMPGGEFAIREPWRMAISHLWNTFGSEALSLPLPCWQNRSAEEIHIITQAWTSAINAPLTSSCGRLFDAVASLLGVRQEVTYEAQAAVELEMLCQEQSAEPYAIDPIAISGSLSVQEMFRHIVQDIKQKVPAAVIAQKFHSSLAELYVQAAIAARAKAGINLVALSGGVFQNRLFFRILLARLREAGFEVISHRWVPTNDGGLALGQVMVAAYTSKME